ncbi:MFS transporter [Zhihengliuella sp.]|uniref:MFS transporter n=1 Tax=Zhihengliuella sp. TaxID=1954483 RepID=UPI002810FBE5|nr:MFS transporter [Zhihengliuella sp.]
MADGGRVPSGSGPGWEGHLPGSPAFRRVIVALFAAGVAAFCQLYATQSMLPALAREFAVSEARAALSVSAATAGLACAVLPWSAVADRLGRRTTLLAALTASVVIGAGVCLAPDYSWLLVARFAQGAAIAGVPATAMAYLSEELSRAAVPVAAGLFVAGNTVGGLTGRLMAGPLGELVSWRLGVGAATVLAAGATLVCLRAAPRPRGFVPVSRASGDRGPSFLARLGVAARDRRLLALYGQAFLLMGGFVAVYNYLGFRLEHAPLNVPPELTAFVFLAYLAGTWSSSRAGRTVRRFGRLRTLLGGTAVMVAGLALTLVPWLPGIVAGMVLLTAGFFVAHSVATGWISAFAPQGRAQATSLYNLGYYGGSSLFGWAVGLAFAPLGWPGVVVGVGALALAAAAWAVVALSGQPGGGRPHLQR